MTQVAGSRRGFLTHAAAASAAAMMGGAAARADDARAGRRVVPGSPSPNYSRAVAFDKLVYVAGVVGAVPGSKEPIPADFAVQCRQAMDNLKASVDASGSTMAHVLKCTCFLTNAGDFATMNKIYVEYFPENPPARSTVVVKELVVPGAKLEIDCVTCTP